MSSNPIRPYPNTIRPYPNRRSSAARTTRQPGEIPAMAMGHSPISHFTMRAGVVVAKPRLSRRQTLALREPAVRRTADLTLPKPYPTPLTVGAGISPVLSNSLRSSSIATTTSDFAHLSSRAPPPPEYPASSCAVQCRFGFIAKPATSATIALLSPPSRWRSREAQVTLPCTLPCPLHTQTSLARRLFR